MAKKDGIKERIAQYLKYKHISATKFEETANIGHGFLSKASSPQVNILEKIFYAFPELNRSWVMTGEGSMLITDDPTDNRVSIPQDAVPVYDIDATCGISSRILSDESIEGYISMPSIRKDCKVIKAWGDSMEGYNQRRGLCGNTQD